MKVLVFGALGWLGGKFANYYADQGHTVVRSVTDIADLWSVRRELQQHAPALVVNAAGRTHSREIPSIDACVDSPAAVRGAIASNVVGAGNVAWASVEYGCRLIHLSSGCIFDGPGPFTEASTPNPPSFYAQTKAMAERVVAITHPKALQLRIRMPISADPHPRNLVTKLAAARTVIDVENSVTVVEDLLEFADALCEQDVTGIVHAVNPGPITFRWLMKAYRDIVDPKHEATIVAKETYKTVDGRSNAILISARDLPVVLPPAQFSVKRALRAYARARVAA